MTIYFGNALDDNCMPAATESSFGVHYFGPQKLVHFLSTLLGLPKPSSGVEYLRLEQYRQALIKHINAAETPPFYTRSFKADQYAVSMELLGRRDELVLAGLDLLTTKKTPERIAALSQIENFFNHKAGAFWVYDKHLAYLLKNLHRYSIPIEKLYYIGPKHLFQVPILRLFNILEEKGVALIPLNEKANALNNDLGHFQNNLQRQPFKKPFQQDGSLMVFRGPNESLMASFIANLLKNNPSYRPGFLLGNACNALDNAFIQEGLPALGIETSSYAKPSLQILKLAPLFLWQPIDPYKLLEFVSLQLKPLDDELAKRIALHIAQLPGIRGDRWYGMVTQFFRELEEAEHPDLKDIRFQYRFWFERTQHDAQQGAPKKEVIEIFEFIEHWATIAFRDSGEEEVNLRMLSIQAGNIKALLETTNEERLTPLEIERIVRTVYEPGRNQIVNQQLGAFNSCNHADGIIQPMDKVLWWNFVDADPTYYFSRWYDEELAFFAEQGIEVETPDRQNQLLNWKRKQPFLKTRRQMVLCIPDKYGGQAINPHPYYGNLLAAFVDFREMDIDSVADREYIAKFFKEPVLKPVFGNLNRENKTFLRLPGHSDLFKNREVETPTSLEDLFYYPYKWFFKHYCKIKSSALLSVVDQSTLCGNLAHRFFEELLVEVDHNWDKETVENWIEERAYSLLQQEGSILLMYGHEAERINFINRIKFAAWTLVNLLLNNNWHVESIEKEVKGKFADISIKGRVDLILKRGEERAILDLKWKGLTYRKQMLKNEEDLQLVLYSKLLSEEERLPLTGFYIIERAALLSRSNKGFREAIIHSASEEDEDEVLNRIYQKMIKTYSWRKQQLENGLIEIRRKETIDSLEEAYANDPVLDLLEMKTKDAHYDDYRILISAIL